MALHTFFFFYYLLIAMPFWDRGIVFLCLLYGFESIIFLDWLQSKDKKPSIFCYLTDSWRKDIDIYTKVNATDFTEIRTRLTDFICRAHNCFTIGA